jgi:hypothetical protein
MKYYYLKRRYSTGFFLFCILCFCAGLAGIINKFHIWLSYITVIISPIVIYYFWKTRTLPSIVIDDNYLRQRKFNVRFNVVETICEWEWIYSITTNSEAHCTYIDWTKIKDKQTLDILFAKKLTDEQKQKYRQLVKNNQIGRICISTFLSEYEQIITHIVSKMKDIEIDETTSKIIEKVNFNK